MVQNIPATQQGEPVTGSPPETTQTEEKPVAKKNTIRAFGEMLSYGWILNNLGFFLFLSALAVLYIANGHMADNRIRRINETARRLKDLQYEYKTIKSDMMFKSRESELVKAAEPLGLAPDSVPPLRIQALQAPAN